MSPVIDSKGFAGQFLDAVCQESASAQRVLAQLYPDGPKCASCRADIVGRKPLDSFWQGGRTYCRSCENRFTPTTGTILEGSHISFAQFEKLMICLSLRLDMPTTLSLTGCSRDTVNNWIAKLRFWESHV